MQEHEPLRDSDYFATKPRHCRKYPKRIIQLGKETAKGTSRHFSLKSLTQRG